MDTGGVGRRRRLRQSSSSVVMVGVWCLVLYVGCWLLVVGD